MIDSTIEVIVSTIVIDFLRITGGVAVASIVVFRRPTRRVGSIDINVPYMSNDLLAREIFGRFTG